MRQKVFISYARQSSSREAKALQEALGAGTAFMDVSDIETGATFPAKLMEALLDAHVVVVFADRIYFSRWYCLRELRVALLAPECIVIAMGEGVDLSMVPSQVSLRNWPATSDTTRLAELVSARLKSSSTTLRHAARAKAEDLVRLTLEESTLPPPLPLAGPRVAGAIPPSIGAHFVGRSDDLAHIHFSLSTIRGAAAALVGRLTAAGGFGKTRIAIEYMHRYGPIHFPGGLFWIDADCSEEALEVQFHDILKSLKPETPHIVDMRRTGLDIRKSTREALIDASQQGPVLVVVDNVPEVKVGEMPKPIGYYGLALGIVTVLATSRQNIGEQGVQSVVIGALPRHASICLLAKGLEANNSELTEAQWGEIAAWVADLPLALDLLNRALTLGAITPRELLGRVRCAEPVEELDKYWEALRESVPENAIRGLSETLAISLQSLEKGARRVAFALSELGPAPISDEVINNIVKTTADYLDDPEIRDEPERIRAILVSRHFLTAASEGNFWMHRLVAGYLRSAGQPWEYISWIVALVVLSDEMEVVHLTNPTAWPRLDAIALHAERLIDICLASVGSNKLREHVAKMAEYSCVLAALVVILYNNQGHYDRARRIGLRVIRFVRRQLGRNTQHQFGLLKHLADAEYRRGKLVLGQRLLESLLAKATLAGDDRLIHLCKGQLGMILWSAGQYAAARGLQEETLAWLQQNSTDDRISIQREMCNLGITCLYLGDVAHAIELLQASLDICVELFGWEQPQTLTSANNLAQALADRGDLAEALKLNSRAFEIRRRALGERHPDTRIALDLLATTYAQHGDYNQARRLQESNLALSENILGSQHPDMITLRGNYAYTLYRLGNITKAKSLLNEALEDSVRVVGANHHNTIVLARNLAELLCYIGDVRLACELMERFLPAARRSLSHRELIDFTELLAHAQSTSRSRVFLRRLRVFLREWFGEHSRLLERR